MNRYAEKKRLGTRIRIHFFLGAMQLKELASTVSLCAQCVGLVTFRSVSVILDDIRRTQNSFCHFIQE